MARCHFCCNVRLVRCLVSQHRLADDVADGKNVRHISPHLVIDRNEAAFIHLDTRRSRTDSITIGATPDSDQNSAVARGWRRLVAAKAHFDAVLVRCHRLDADAKKNVLVALAEPLRERPYQIGVRAGHQRRRQLHDRHRHTECIVNAGHFQTDDAATNNQQRVRQRRKFECPGGVDDTRIVWHTGQPHALGARGDDELRKRDRFRPPLGKRHRHLVRPHNFAAAVDNRDLTLLGHRAQSTGQTRNHRFFPVAEPWRIDIRLTEANAVVGHGGCVLDHFGGMQQRFRRNTADVQAHATEPRVALDQNDVEAEIGRPERGRIPPGPEREPADRNRSHRL